MEEKSTNVPEHAQTTPETEDQALLLKKLIEETQKSNDLLKEILKKMEKII